MNIWQGFCRTVNQKDFSERFGICSLENGSATIFIVPPCFNTNNKPHDGPWSLKVILYKKGVCGGTSIKSVSDVRASFLPGIFKKNKKRYPGKITTLWDAIPYKALLDKLTISLTFNLKLQ